MAQTMDEFILAGESSMGAVDPKTRIAPVARDGKPMTDPHSLLGRAMTEDSGLVWTSAAPPASNGRRRTSIRWCRS